MFCKKCGTEILDGSQFCSNCGQAVTVTYEEKIIFQNETVAKSSMKKFIIIGAIAAGVIAIGLGGGMLVGYLSNKERKEEVVVEDSEKKVVKETETKTEEKAQFEILSSVTEVKTEANHRINLEYEISNSDKKIIPKVFFSSADESIATVDENGVVTGVASGKTVITAKCDGSECYWNVNIIPEASITCLNSDISCYLGDTAQIQYQTSGGDDTDQVSFTSSNEAVATVSGDGIISAKEKGTAQITISYGDFAKVLCNVNVKEFDTLPDGEYGIYGSDGSTIEDKGSYYLVNGVIHHYEYYSDNFDDYDNEDLGNLSLRLPYSSDCEFYSADGEGIYKEDSDTFSYVDGNYPEIAIYIENGKVVKLMSRP